MNRSEELAKLLGIEPKKEIAMHCGTNCNRHNCIMDRDCKHYKAIGAYPNFTKPSNFVKLLELKKDKYNNTILRFMLCWFGHSELEDLYNREDIIDKIIDFLSSEDYQKSETLIKNAQQTDWTY
jgi:hypothetical protein